MTDHWVDEFLKSPSENLSALFAGREIGAASSLETPEFLQQAFADRSESDRLALDDALYEWLDEMRTHYSDRVRELGSSVYTKRVVDALIALQLTQLSSTREKIRSSLNHWLVWLRPLRTAPERDPALECWRLMAIGQTDTNHASDWLRLTGEGRAEYLNVGLRGIFALPNEGNAQINQTLALRALFQYAVSKFPESKGAQRFFRRRYSAVRVRYPRAEEHWRRLLKLVLESTEYDENERASSLRQLLQTEYRLSRSLFPATKSNVPQSHTLPSREKLQKLRQDIEANKENNKNLTERFFALIKDHAEYAERAGTGYYFVRSLHNLANRLLENQAFSSPQMNPLLHYIQRAISWEPWSPYCWMLLGDWYGATKNVLMRESVMREMLRLFPTHEASRVELAQILIERGDLENDLEAGTLLREAVSLSRKHKYARVALAHHILRMEDNREDEAKSLLLEVLDVDPENDVATKFLDSITAGTYKKISGVREYAKKAMTQGTKNWIKSAVTVFENQALGTNSIAAPPWAAELFRRGQISSEFVRAERGQLEGISVTAPSILRFANECDPLAGLYAQWLHLDDVAACPPNAWAWQACQLWQGSSSAEQWVALGEKFSDVAAETSFLHILSRAEGAPTPAQWHEKFGRLINEPGNPAISYIGARMESLPHADNTLRRAYAFTTLANLALEPPVFATLHNQ